MNNCAIISSDTPPEIKNNLAIRGFSLLEIPPCARLPRPIASHPDIQLCVIGNTVYCHADIDPFVAEKLSKYKKVHICKKRLGHVYRDHASFNAVVTGSAFIHNLELTDPEILESVQQNMMPLFSVKQGYTRCSAVPVGKTALITADHGIAQTLTAAGFAILEVSPGHVILEGHAYGFIGGAAGIHDATVYFAGNIMAHPDHARIAGFLSNHSHSFFSLADAPLVDIGSILFI